MKIKQTLISIAIAIIFALFVGYGIEVFDASPDYEDFCPRDVYLIKNESDCLEQGGVWDEEVGVAKVPVPRSEFMCQPAPDCYQKVEDAQSSHDKIVFIVSMVAGLLAVIVAITLKKDVVSNGILAGGIILLIYGSMRYWRHANSTLKFILLGITLAVLIWIAVKKLDKK